MELWLSYGVRVLLILGDPNQRNACGDYFDARGCDVDRAENLEDAKPFLRFRGYDLAVADLSAAEPTEREIAAFESASRDAKVRVLLTTVDLPSSASLHVLTKPQPLDTLFSLGRAAFSSRSPREGRVLFRDDLSLIDRVPSEHLRTD